MLTNRSLKEENGKAGAAKRAVEQMQRDLRAVREESGTPFVPQFWERVGQGQLDYEPNWDKMRDYIEAHQNHD